MKNKLFYLILFIVKKDYRYFFLVENFNKKTIIDVPDNEKIIKRFIKFYYAHFEKKI